MGNRWKSIEDMQKRRNTYENQALSMVWISSRQKLKSSTSQNAAQYRRSGLQHAAAPAQGGPEVIHLINFRRFRWCAHPK